MQKKKLEYFLRTFYAKNNAHAFSFPMMHSKENKTASVMNNDQEKIDSNFGPIALNELKVRVVRSVNRIRFLFRLENSS